MSLNTAKLSKIIKLSQHKYFGGHFGAIHGPSSYIYIIYIYYIYILYI